MSTQHTPENTVRVSIERVVIPAGHEVIRDRRRVRLERDARAWQFTIPSSRASLGVGDHNVLVETSGAWACCSCAAAVNLDHCTLVDDPAAILRRHGLLPPADPGGAVGEPPELAGLAECEDAARDDWETVELSPEHPGGFWTGTAYGPMHVSGDPHMGDETLGALREMAELAVRQHLGPTPNQLDALVAAGGDRWLVSRTPPRVTLTCPACYETLTFLAEGGAARYVAGGGACGCGEPTPPAPGAARKPLQDHLATLYGSE